MLSLFTLFWSLVAGYLYMRRNKSEEARKVIDSLKRTGRFRGDEALLVLAVAFLALAVLGLIAAFRS